MAENSQERLLRYLTDAHAAEEGGLASLKDIAQETTDADVRSAVQDHLTVTQSQADRLAARIAALGGKTHDGKSLINTIIGKGSDLLNVFHDKEDKQTQDVIKAYALENFEVGMYTSLKAYANAIGDAETAQLAATILGEEQLAGEQLLRLIPQVAVGALRNTTDAGIQSAS
jgi:ferritin-like metal-binding protein YciE